MTYSGERGQRLVEDINKAGFYPQLVIDVVQDSLDGRSPVSHLVQLETHIDRTEVHRHTTVLVLAEDVLHVTHVDDEEFDESGRDVVARVSTETVGISQIRSVTLSYSYYQPANYRPDSPISEVTLAIAWTGTLHVDLAPALCEDPQCQADHGYSGTAAREDIVLRISAEADGPTAVEGAREFARTLRRANLSPLTDGAQIAQPVHGRTPAPRRTIAATPRTRFTDRFTGRDGGAAR